MIVVALLASRVEGQPSPDYAQQLRRLDSLAVERLAELRNRDRAEIAERRVRSVEVDGVRLLVDSAAPTWAIDGFRLGWQDVGERGRSWAQEIAPGLELRMQVDWSGGGRGVELGAYDRDNPALTATVPFTATDAASARRATTALFDRLLHNVLDVDVNSWLAPVGLGSDVHQLHVALPVAGNTVFAPIGPGDALWSAVRYHAVRVPSASSRQCLAGSWRACATAMGIGTGTGAPLSTWYEPADHRWIWLKVAPEGDSGRRALKVACERGADDACERFVASTAPGLVDAPLAHHDARRALLMLALDAGGPDAVQRLLASRGPIQDRLAIVAGVPFDSLMATWQRRVADARPRDLRVHPLALVTGLLGAMTLLGLPRRRA